MFLSNMVRESCFVCCYSVASRKRAKQFTIWYDILVVVICITWVLFFWTIYFLLFVCSFFWFSSRVRLTIPFLRSFLTFTLHRQSLTILIYFKSLLTTSTYLCFCPPWHLLPPLILLTSNFFGTRSSHILSRWPNHRNLLCCKMQSTLSISAISLIFVHFILSLRVKPQIVRTHLLMKIWSRCLGVKEVPMTRFRKRELAIRLL